MEKREPRSYEEMAAAAPSLEELLWRRRGIDIRTDEALAARWTELFDREAWLHERSSLKHQVADSVLGACLGVGLILYIIGAGAVVGCQRLCKRIKR